MLGHIVQVNDMQKNQLIAVIVVAIVVVAAAAVAVVTLNKGDSKTEKPAFAEQETVVIYGNANNDAYINNDDITYVQDIIDKKTTWDSTNYPFADANHDGEITSADIDQIKMIINNESGKVWYLNSFGNDQEIQYPLVNRTIAVTYWQQAEAVSILGHWKDVKVASRAATVNYPDMYPLTTDKGDVVETGTTGSSTPTEDTLKAYATNNVDLIIATASSGVKAKLDTLSTYTTNDIQIVYLWHSGPKVVSTILTLGVLMEEEQKAEAYASFFYKQTDAVKSVVAGLSSDEIPGIVCNITYSDTDARYTKNGGYCVMFNNNEGAFYLLNMLGNVISESSDITDWGYGYRDKTWFANNNDKIDFIVNCESGIYFSKGADKSTYNDRFETNAKYFENLDAYNNGKVIGSVYAFLGGFSGSAMLPLLAYMIYPDKFSESDALDTLQYWMDNFTNAKLDVKDMGGYYYTGSNYDIWYKQ